MRPAARPGQASLADSLSRVNPVQQGTELRFGMPAEPTGWVTCGELLADAESFDRWRKVLAGWLLDTYGEAPDQTTAGYVLYWYLFVPAYLGAALFHHERRVPSLRPRHLAFRMAWPRPHPDGIAALSPTFACLPDDPAAGSRVATVMPDEQALAGLLRARYVAHAARFFTVFAPGVRFGRHTLWANATDALDSSLWYVGRYAGNEAAGVLDARLVLADRFAPLTSPSTLRPSTGAGEATCWTRRRESCCFHYLLAEGGGACETCPRLSPRD
ncbi:MAG TPA: (2Fe-2S)-binding protein [Actinophytocola sp.]|uniref:(2Fe-2S)-binding protein n=1 Tax=Actinophytocola sp. TaxID=1872138 RepID=UPI002DDDABEA|nr:(2Fe-2S)-binding protein [Actinophytocola sp.]HEV2782651.1 (2Fe-2S)-binding protein [Actinophytocola sp.]